jgi:hypothetical protein
MDNSVIPFPLTSTRENDVTTGASARLAGRYAVELFELARSVCEEPSDCVFCGYCWQGDEFRALYKHIKTGFLAAFGYDPRTRKLVHISAADY